MGVVLDDAVQESRIAAVTDSEDVAVWFCCIFGVECGEHWRVSFWRRKKELRPLYPC